MLFWLWKETENECLSSEEEVLYHDTAEDFAH